MALKAFGPIFAEVEGEPGIIAFHGWGRRGADFALAFGGLGYLAPDLPGFGASPPPGAAIGAAGYVELLAPVLSAAKPGAVLVGHSFGGRVATVLAAQQPERYAGLVLTGTPLLKLGPTPKVAFGFRLGRWAHRRGLLPDAVMEGLRNRHGSHDYRAATGVMRDILVKAVNESYGDVLPQLSLPVILLWGADDREVPVAVAEQAAQRIRRVEMRIVPRAGHFLPTSHPSELREAVLALTK